MRERGRGVSFFLSFFLSLSLSRKKPPSVPQKSVVGFFLFLFLFPSPKKTKEKICHTFLDLVSSQKGRTKNKDGH